MPESIEEQAKRLGCPLADFSAAAENVAAPLASDRCTVFMERDINQYLAEGYAVNELLAATDGSGGNKNETITPYLTYATQGSRRDPVRTPVSGPEEHRVFRH